MPLTPGTSIGHYDVTALLGEGGMGQVWQSRDQVVDEPVRHQRIPATKLGLGGDGDPSLVLGIDGGLLAFVRGVERHLGVGVWEEDDEDS